MPQIVACAGVGDGSPQELIAEHPDTLSWALAHKLIARTPGWDLSIARRHRLRPALREERRGEAVQLWMQDLPEFDGYLFFGLHSETCVEQAALAFGLSPLFED